MLKVVIYAFIGCLGIGFIVGEIEKCLGRVGWVEGHKPYGIYEKHIKRPLDFGLSLFALIILSPLLLIIAIAVRIKLGSPVVFKQERPGLGGEIFTIKKFRTMTDEKDAEGNLLPDEKRLTKFGRWLRSTSMDELLELFNILSGELSVVGPRPLLVEYIPYYTEDEKHRHDVRMGLTGRSQALGRNNLSWKDRFLSDVQYVNNITFMTDLKILILTVKNVVLHKDVVAPDSMSAESNFADERKKESMDEVCQREK